MWWVWLVLFPGIILKNKSILFTGTNYSVRIMTFQQGKKKIINIRVLWRVNNPVFDAFCCQFQFNLLHNLEILKLWSCGKQNVHWLYQFIWPTVKFASLSSRDIALMEEFDILGDMLFRFLEESYMWRLIPLSCLYANYEAEARRCLG